jgi:hypothetical protein
MGQYKTEELIEKSLKAIEQYGVHFIEDVIVHLPCSRATFYNHGLDKLDAIKDAIDVNKIKLKTNLRKKWYESDNATTQIALYKLIANPNELKALTNQTISGDADNPINISDISIRIVTPNGD